MSGGSDPAVDLLFNIAEQSLDGVSEDFKEIHCHAVSGGRAGSKTPNVVNSILANNPFAVAVTDRTHSETSGKYGPLPLGLYWMEKHPGYLNRVRLTPMNGTYMFGRDGMQIHPRGPIGSNGCIVPDTSAQVMQILGAIHAFRLCNQNRPVLKVTASGDLDRFAPFTQLA